MAKILVVDDEPDLEILIKQKFRKKIRSQEYEFHFVKNGEEALGYIKQYPEIEIILSDINMPGMDGLALLTHLNEDRPLIKAVMVSAYGDMKNIRAAMNGGAFDFITKPIDFEDLEMTMDKTLQHVAHIRETLFAIKENNILKMYVDETVLNFMAKPEFEDDIAANEMIEASVVFIDICGFTAISEQEAPDNVVKLLNTYFDIIVKAIIGQEGYVDKFIGDAVMAVFRKKDSLTQAIKACLQVRADIERLPVWHEAVDFIPKVSMGINFGEMVSGNIGSITLKRLDYTVIGDVVNTAQRLQAAAKPNQIILNERSYQEIKESFECENLGTIKLKNKQTEFNIYNVIARSHSV